MVIISLKQAQKEGYDYPVEDFKTENELVDSWMYKNFTKNHIDFCVCPYRNFKGEHLQIRRKRKDFASKVMQYRIKWGL